MAVETIRAAFGWVGVNTVVSRPTLSDVEALCRDLIDKRVDHWALLTEAPRGNRAGSSTTPKEIFEAVDAVETTARNHGFLATIEKWDYLTAPHSYLLVEPSGHIVIPGTTESDDILIGEASRPDLGILEATLKELTDKKRATFFAWDHRRYFG